MRATRSIAVLAVLAVALACGGGDGGGGPTGPVTVTGTYEGTHSFSLGPVPFDQPCEGRVTIGQQSGASFTGTLTVDNTGICADFGDSGAITGTVEGNQVRFDLDGFGIEELLAGIGCVPTQPESLFIGRLEGDRLTVTLSRDFTCPDQGIPSVTVTWSIDATRA